MARRRDVLAAAGVAGALGAAADDGEPADVVAARTAQGLALVGREDVVARRDGVPVRDGDGQGSFHGCRRRDDSPLWAAVALDAVAFEAVPDHLAWVAGHGTIDWGVLLGLWGRRRRG